MKKTNDMAAMKSVSYCSPEAMILDVKSEGVLCSSNGSWADGFVTGDELTDYEQIN